MQVAARNLEFEKCCKNKRSSQILKRENIWGRYKRQNLNHKLIDFIKKNIIMALF